MALYDLRCNDCQQEFNKMISFSKLSEVCCPSCGSTNHERVYKATIKGPVTSSGSSSYSVPPSTGFT